MQVNIHDVAEKAGVSISTVSRVVNNNYPVKKETREKIEKVIEELEYRPNEVARSLILKKTSNIGVIVPGITNPFFHTIGEEIINVLKKKGFIISLFSTEGKESLEKDIVNNVLSRNMDGVIVIDPSIQNLNNGFFEKTSRRIPLIVINGYTKDYDFNFVSYNEDIGTREAFNHLLDLGHKEILFIRGDSSLSYDIKENIYLEILDKKGLDYKNIVNVGMGNTIEVIQNTKDILVEKLEEDKNITSIFACNDLMALGSLDACNKLGLKVPEDISIIGFDNTLLSTVVTPKLTTVDLKIETIGRIAAEKLLKVIENENKLDYNIKIIFDTDLIVRKSCSEVRKVRR